MDRINKLVNRQSTGKRTCRGIDHYTSLEDLKDEEEVKSLARTRCHKFTGSTWSYVEAVCSL